MGVLLECVADVWSWQLSGLGVSTVQWHFDSP